jgi:alpha-glucosidase
LDDGHTFNYQRGEFMRQSFTCSQAEHSVTVQTAAPEGTYKPWFNEVQFTVYGITSAPARVTLDGVGVQNSQFDAARGVLTVVVPQHTAATKLEISY